MCYVLAAKYFLAKAYFSLAVACANVPENSFVYNSSSFTAVSLEERKASFVGNHFFYF